MKIKVFQSVFRCSCGSCDPETIWVLAKPNSDGSHTEAWGSWSDFSEERFLSHCDIVPHPDRPVRIDWDGDCREADRRARRGF